MEGLGVVRTLAGGYAEVAVRRGAGCGAGCETGGCACHALDLFGAVADRELRVRARNLAAAREGDVVVLGLADRVYFKGSLIVYILPVLFLFAGAILGPGLARLLSWSISGDLASAALGALGFAAAVLAVGLYARSRAAREQFLPEIVRVVGREGGDLSGGSASGPIGGNLS